jgi:hypothetical protein
VEWVADLAWNRWPKSVEYASDGKSRYDEICRRKGIIHLGCWDHARRKFVTDNLKVYENGQSENSHQS